MRYPKLHITNVLIKNRYISPSRLIYLPEDVAMRLVTPNTMTGGRFANASYYLNPKNDWIIGILDDIKVGNETLLLVPLTKDDG